MYGHFKCYYYVDIITLDTNFTCIDINVLAFFQPIEDLKEQNFNIACLVYPSCRKVLMNIMNMFYW